MVQIKKTRKNTSKKSNSKTRRNMSKQRGGSFVPKGSKKVKVFAPNQVMKHETSTPYKLGRPIKQLDMTAIKTVLESSFPLKQHELTGAHGKEKVYKKKLKNPGMWYNPNEPLIIQYMPAATTRLPELPKPQLSSTKTKREQILLQKLSA